MSESKSWGFTPLLPKYSEVKLLLPVLDGVPKGRITTFFARIHEQTGTPQDPLDWSVPDEWIPARLTGQERDLAQQIWLGTERSVNPRHARGSYYFINRHNLLDLDPLYIYRAGDRTQLFLDSDNDIIRQLDDAEGIRVLLGILATKANSKFGDLLPEFAEFAISHSDYKSDSAIRSLLRFRLGNMLDRGLIDREGITYTISADGVDYAVISPNSRELDPSPLQDVTKAIREFNNGQVATLRETLSLMHPYKFEHLIRDLLEAMGYEDVIVTRESGDRGVDVVATVQFGITTITEVVQVKRQQGTITRPTIDQLRGALPYHNAIRGTIITTGTFSSGCAEAALFLGAAPISLIDGNRLEELLVEHEIGIRKRPATLYEIDSDLLASGEQQLEVDDELSLLG